MFSSFYTRYTTKYDWVMSGTILFVRQCALR